MKKQLFAVFLFLISSISLLAQERHGPYKVTQVVDGDTFWVKLSSEKEVKVRLIGIDTPEVKWEGMTEELAGGKEALLNWIFQKRLHLGTFF